MWLLMAGWTLVGLGRIGALGVGVDMGVGLEEEAVVVVDGGGEGGGGGDVSRPLFLTERERERDELRLIGESPCTILCFRLIHRVKFLGWLGKRILSFLR